LNPKPQQVIQSIKRLDCSPVSSKNFSEILPPNGWRPGPGKVGQGGLKILHLWCHLQKTRTPQAKIFFRVKSTILADPFEPLKSSLAQSAEELGHW